MRPLSVFGESVISLGLQALLNTKQLQKDQDENKKSRGDSNCTHAPQRSHPLFRLAPQFDPPLPFAPCVSIAEKKEKDVITGIFAHLPLPDRIEFHLAVPSCEQLFTHR